MTSSGKPATVFTSLPNNYLRQFFRYLGGDPALLVGTSETPETLSVLEGTNSFQDYCRFFLNARSLEDEPAIGLVLGQVNQLSNIHGPLSVAVYQSRDIQDCLELMQRFIPMRSSAFKATWYEDDDHVGLTIRCQESPGEAYIPVIEALMLGLSNLIAEASQHQVMPSLIEFDYSRPAYVDRYFEAFGNTSCRFSSSRLRLLITRTDTRVRIDTNADAGLRASAIRRCEEILRGAQAKQSHGERLRQIFSDNPGQLWTLSDMARHLNTSESTLQRRLADEGTSYRELSDGWLKSEAGKLLAQRNLSVESIAMLMGYSDVRAFRNACQRWFGQSPMAFRQALSVV